MIKLENKKLETSLLSLNEIPSLNTFSIYRLQAKIVYNVPFSDDEKQNIKFVIQRNVYNYIGILLEGRARFEEDYLAEMRRQRADEPGPSGLHIKFYI